jgi:hypothetical protein
MGDSGARQRPRHAEFVPYFQVSLQAPGDFIYRCTLLRIDFWTRQLNRSTNAIEDELRSAGAGDLVRRIRKAYHNYREPLNRLNDLCENDPLWPARQAAVILVQLHAANNPKVDLPWLGPVAAMAPLAKSLLHFYPNAAATSLASAFAELARYYGDDPDVGAQIELMAAERPLCLVDGIGRRELTWNGRPIEVKWFVKQRAWTLLSALVEHARTGQGVDNASELGISLKDAKTDLKSLLPRDLFGHIQSQERGGYKLDLPRDHIYMVRLAQVERLHVV